MASITKSKTGAKRALFYDETKTRRTVYLGKVSDKEADTIRRRIESILSWNQVVANLKEFMPDSAKSPCRMHSIFVSYEAVGSTCR
jgi:DNA-directed RNA polymerase subunit F